MNQENSPPIRVLACVLCQQRKIKCDRTFPCSQCLKTGAQCLPATRVPRKRRRRFAERDLLDRLRHYEALLREHNIQFEPLHPGHDAELHVSESRARDATNAFSPTGSKSEDTLSPSQAEETYEAKSVYIGIHHNLLTDIEQELLVCHERRGVCALK
jgi:hypothetical protein